MEDSSFFMQWAMSTLDQHPTAAAYAGGDGGGGGGGVGSAAAFPSLQALRSGGSRGDLMVQVDHRASSWSSTTDSPGGAGAMDHDAAAAAAAASAAWSPHTARARTTAASRTMSWNFGAASAQPTADIALPAATAARGGHTPGAGAGKRSGGRASPAVAATAAAVPETAAAAASSPGPVQDHIIAERRRREKINQRFIELSTVIPGLKKMDKATILGDAVKYVRELQEKVKSMEEDEGHRPATSATVHSAVLVKKKPSQPASSSCSGDGDGDAGLPEIEARLSEKNVLVRIHCENSRGLLVRVLAEVEELRLAITHTSVMPFPATTAIITITAKVEEGFSSTVEEMVRRLSSVLSQHCSSSSSENSEKKPECYC